MKIGSVNPIITQRSAIQVEAAYQRPRVQPMRDSVELSPDAKLFSEAFAAARRSLHDVKPDQEFRVQQIMEQMESGAYQVDLSAVCDKLLI